MDLEAAGLNEQPFRTHGRPLSIVSYGSYELALENLRETYDAANGLMLFQGPALSGKSTIIRSFVDELPDGCSVAIVDGNGLNTAGLLESMLRQFGYVIEHSSTNELLGMLRVIALQQTASQQPPILFIESAHSLNPSALRVLCEFAELNVRGVAALKIVLCSERPLQRLFEEPPMDSIAMRVRCNFHLHPMTKEESVRYLYTKLRAAGSDAPEFILPKAACAELWRASGGWPGILDRIALLSLAKAETLPIRPENIEWPVVPQGTWSDFRGVEPESQIRQTSKSPQPPTLFVTHDGETLHELQFDAPRLLVGRSDHNDIAIPSRFVSRHHALLVRHGGTTFLMDLNSTNGTYVNSRRVSNHVLVDNDVITIGHHRIKYCDPHATQRGSLRGDEFADTAIMKTLDDMRNLLEQENTELLPAATENLPTSGL